MEARSVYKSPEGENAVLEFYNSMLKRWQVPFRELKVSTRHGETSVISWGDESGPSIVLLHGSGSNSLIWGNEAALWGGKYRVYAIDIIGEPGKSSQNRPDLNGPSLACWLEDALNALGIGKTFLIGLSLGGWVSVKYCLHYPERVKKLALICPGGIIQPRISFILNAIFMPVFGRKGMDRIKRIVFNNKPLPEEVDRFYHLLSTHYRYRGAIPVFRDEDLRRIDTPLFFLGGGKDNMFNVPKMAIRLQSLVPDMKSTVLPEEGHVLTKIADHIIPFLSAPA